MDNIQLISRQKQMRPLFSTLIISFMFIGAFSMITFQRKVRGTLDYLPTGLCHRFNGSMFSPNQLEGLYVYKNDGKRAYMNGRDALRKPFILNNFSSLNEFIINLHDSIISRRLISDLLSIRTIFRDPPYSDMVKPSCDGLWMEFGVYRGSSISHIATWKSMYCGNKSEPVYGFDTFTGLPTPWRPGYDRGFFKVPDGARISVPSNVRLVKGLFIDTLPTHLRLLDRKYQCKTPVSFVHIDCDIYDGARDVLFLLGSRFVSGTIIVFDELFNYPHYEKHEIKTLFEFLSGSNLQLIPLGTPGDIDLHPTTDKFPQSFAFIVN